MLGHRARLYIYRMLLRPGAFATTVGELEQSLWTALMIADYPRNEIHTWLIRAARKVDQNLPSCVGQPLVGTARDLDHAAQLLCDTAPAWFLAPDGPMPR